MAYSKALVVVKSKLNIEVERTKDALADGTAKTYDEYKGFCGVLKGLAIALREIDTFLKEDDDE